MLNFANLSPENTATSTGESTTSHGKLRIAFFVGAALIIVAVAVFRLHFSMAFSLISFYYIVLNVAALPFAHKDEK